MAPSDPTFDSFPELSSLFDPPTLDEWRAAAEKSLKGRPLEKLSVRTHEGLSVDPLFTAADGGPDPGFPGLTPYVRGRTALGPGPAGWSVCQAVSCPDPTTAAVWAAEDLGRGVDALWLIFDHSVRTASNAKNELRGDGICIGSSSDLESFFTHFDPARHTVHLDAGGNAPAVAAAVIAAARRAGVNLHDLDGSIGFDPLGALAADGKLTAGIDGSFATLAELIAWIRLHAPGFRAAAVSTTAHHLAGATAVQELAYALATAVETLRALSEYDIEPDTAAGQLIFRFAVGRDLFMEAAKLRAFRRLWSRASGVCGVRPGRQAALIHAVSSPRGLATLDPWVNGLRTTVGAFAAVVGGADVITVLPFDSAIGPPDELGRRIAANSQTILAEESHLARVVDPGGGSWYLENLTDRLARESWRRFQSIEAAGGMVAALRDGAVASELAETADERRRSIATRRDPITGVSSYPNLGENRAAPATTAPPELTGAAQPAEELARVLAAAAAPIGDGSLMDAAVVAAAADAGIGSLAAALRGTRDAAVLPPLPMTRDSVPYETLRDASDAHEKATGARPRIFLANMGPISEHKPRATFATRFFEAGGIEAVGNTGFDTVDAAAEAFAAAGTRMAVICSSDARYPEVVPELAAALDEQGARTVLLAGKPGEQEAKWRASGVTGFIHLGCSQLDMLVDLLEEEGVLHV